jgi:hypothetical protein
MNIEKFKDKLIAFDFENEMMNATDMLKSYPNKRMNDFLKTEETKNFISAMESDNDLNRVTEIQPVIISKGNYSDKRSQGTWMHRILAYKFAAWLDPEFELFVYKVFDKVIKEKLEWQQRQLDYFWDKEDQKDIYNR